MNRIAIVLALTVIALASGCGAAARDAGRSTTARVTHLVEQDSGGIVELSGPIVPATEEAMMAMTEHCGGRWHRLDAAAALAMRSADAEAKSGEGEDDASSESWAIDDDRLIAYECTTRAAR